MTDLEKRVEWLEMQMRLVHRTLDKMADRKTEPQTEKFPQKWTDWCKECGKKERCVRAGFMPQCYESEDEPHTERSE